LYCLDNSVEVLVIVLVLPEVKSLILKKIGTQPIVYVIRV